MDSYTGVRGGICPLGGPRLLTLKSRVVSGLLGTLLLKDQIYPYLCERWLEGSMS